MFFNICLCTQTIRNINGSDGRVYIIIYINYILYRVYISYTCLCVCKTCTRSHQKKNNKNKTRETYLFLGRAIKEKKCLFP